MMKQKKVKFVSADEAKEFVSIASGCDFDVNVFYNRMIIDAKSLLGVLSLDLTKILTVEYDGENAPFEAFLEKESDARGSVKIYIKIKKEAAAV